VTTVAAALCWFDEAPERLTRCVERLAGVADVLVALDGRWDMFPHERNISPIDQAEALHAAAAAIGLPVLDETCRVDTPWPSQVVKRGTLMQLAAREGDWVLVIDGDEYVEECDRDAFRAALELTDLDVARVLTHRHGSSLTTRHGNPRRVFRSSAGLRIELAHNGCRADDGRWLNGDPAYVELVEAADLRPVITLAHMIGERGRTRDRLDREYSMARRRSRIEAWSPR
jgi:hypothetical protein